MVGAAVGLWSPGNRASFSCTPAVGPARGYPVSVTVTDSNGNWVATGEFSLWTFTLVVDPALTVSPSATVNPVDVGQATTISAGASGGSGTYTSYAWSGLPSGCGSPGNVVSFSCTPAVGSTGTYTVRVTVTDTNGNAVTEPFTLTVRIAPPSTYSVTFTEKGIPANTLAKYGWTVVLDGIVMHSTTATIGFTLSNGTYLALITGPSGYRMAGGGGGLVAGSTQSVTVSGATTRTPLFLRGPTFTLAFSEKGLPQGQSWCVEVDDYQQCSAKSSVDYRNLTLAAYRYAVVSPLVGQGITAKLGARGVSPSGTLMLRWSETMALTFVYRYAVTFTETGLPGGTNWCVKIGKSTECSTGVSVIFDLPNGTYAFKVTTASVYSLTPMSGTVVVHGAALLVGLSAYTVTFTETGLPSGTHWCVQVGKNTECSTGASIGFADGNGTYAYKVGAVSGYTVSPSKGTVTVLGSPVTVPVTYTATKGGVPATGISIGMSEAAGLMPTTKASPSGEMGAGLSVTTVLGLLGAALVLGRTGRKPWDENEA